MDSISNRIYYAVQKAGLSYGDLSKETGVPKSALQRYATGETKNIPLPRLEAIAKATGVSTAYLMGWEEEAPAPSPQEQIIQETIQMLIDLTPQEFVQVTAFVAGLKAARAAAQSPQSSDP